MATVEFVGGPYAGVVASMSFDDAGEPAAGGMLRHVQPGGHYDISEGRPNRLGALSFSATWVPDVAGPDVSPAERVG
ncbi:MAG: hypothetical protein M3N95_10530 [Actinomycetota bacterium]|nr:hypothetical protein [Actinomycetota bacterium]